MNAIWKTPEGSVAVRARYAQFLAYWPVANTQVRLPTALGESLVIASGQVGAPTVPLLHGSMAKPRVGWAMWQGLYSTSAPTPST